MRILYAIILVILIIVVFYCCSTRSQPYEDYLYGFWLADDSFCEDSDIESMMLFIGEAKTTMFGKATRDCYLIIMNDMCNQSAQMTYRTGWAPIGIKTYNIGVDVKFDDEQIWPDNVNCRLDILAGTLKIYKDDTVYAKLVKQHDITNVAKKVNAATE